MKNRFLTIALLSVVLFSSCKKDKDGSDKPREELMLGTWKLSAFTISPAYDYDEDGTPETNLFPLRDECEDDNRVIFEQNGIVKIDEGADNCDPDFPQVDTSTWSLEDDDKVLVVDGDVFNISEVNNSSLKITETFTEDNKTYTATYTYTKI